MWDPLFRDSLNAISPECYTLSMDHVLPQILESLSAGIAKTLILFLRSIHTQQMHDKYYQYYHIYPSSVTEYPELCATEIMKFCSIYSVPLPWRYFGPRKSGKSHFPFFFLHGGDTLQLQIKYITTSWQGGYPPCSRAARTS